MATSTEITIQDRKRNIISGLCKCTGLDPKIFLGDIDSDVKSLCGNILKSSREEAALECDSELTKWITFIENLPVESKACLGSLEELNNDLVPKSVLLGSGLKPSEADVIVFSAVHPYVISLPDSDRVKLPHLMRWMDHIQHEKNFMDLFQKILLQKAEFDPPLPKTVAKVEVDSNAKKIAQSKNDAKSSDIGLNTKKNDTGLNTKNGDDKVAVDNKTALEKKKDPVKEADEKDQGLSVSLLKIQVGLVRKASKHPSADSLLVEDIDVGEAKCRQVVSGLAKYISPEDLTNRRVVLITNVKPGKLRDIVSEGLVLCASNEDHTIVEPLIAPEGAQVGERVSFSGHEGKPEDVLNPKKKQLEKITPHLFTDDNGVAMFKGIPFMTSGGPCTSSIPKASIK